ncbi:MAG: GNAT family N-acetyltransferase [Anaerolineae bacterium]|nr:GNAT family N-acetyltransferase [Anaerolineae bacterium]
MSDSPTLTIRGQHSDDWSELYTLWSDEAILRESLELPYMAEDAFRDQANTPAHVHVLIAEMSSLSGRKHIIGAAWLSANPRSRRRHVGELALMVRAEHRGTEAEAQLVDKALTMADQWLGLRRVEAIVFAANEGLLALFESKGFEREVLMRQYALRDGKLSDAVQLARIRGEA